MTNNIKYNKNWKFFINEEILSCHFYDENNIGLLMEPISNLQNIYSYVSNNPEESLKNFKYFFVHNKEFVKQHSKIIWAPVTACTWIKNPTIYKKNKLVSMISSEKAFAPGHHVRLSWVNRLGPFVDGYGLAFNNPIEFKEQGLKQYMFTICIENEQTLGYFTEKIIDCFSAGTIPVYWGDPGIEEYFNKNGIITLTESFDISQLTPELYYSKMDAIKENFEIAKKYKNIKHYFKNTY
jgi:hypothetical protein